MTGDTTRDDQLTWVEIKEAEQAAMGQAAENVTEPTAIVRPQ